LVKISQEPRGNQTKGKEINFLIVQNVQLFHAKPIEQVHHDSNTTVSRPLL